MTATRPTTRSAAVRIASIVAFAAVSSCGGDAAGPDTALACPDLPSHIVPLSVVDTAAVPGGGTAGTGSLGYAFTAELPQRMVAEASATTTGALTEEQRTSVYFRDYVALVPADESRAGEIAVVRFALAHRQEICCGGSSPGTAGSAVARIQTSFHGGAALSTSTSSTAVDGDTLVVEQQMGTARYLGEDWNEVSASVWTSAQAYGDHPERRARSELSLTIPEVVDLDGNPFPVRICSALGLDYE